MAGVQTAVRLNGNGGAPTGTRKPRGANKPKPREFVITQTDAGFALTIGGVDIPMESLDTIKNVLFGAMLKEGVTQVTFTRE